MSDFDNYEKQLLYLLYHPSEPCFMSKHGYYFALPQQYVPKEYQNVARTIYATVNKTNGAVPIEIRDVSYLFSEDFLTRIQVLKKKDRFSYFIPKHRELANMLIDTFMDLRLDELLHAAAIIREITNPELFNYCYSVALLHRNDTKNLKILNYVECFPEQFIPGQDLAYLRQICDVYRNQPDQLPIVETITTTGNNKDLEFSLVYFREDIGVNLHHWHWHLLYPFAGREDIVNKNRRGELFYYSHHQMMSRYNIERLCNNLNIAESLFKNNFNEPIKEGYFPSLDTKFSSVVWAPRPPNVKLSDIKRLADGVEVEIGKMKAYERKILDAIDTKFLVKADGTRERLDGDDGIDKLGNILEAAPQLNAKYDDYGNLHNSGHLMISFLHDPYDEFNQPPGVMSSTTTAMRDPIFYRWHSYVDDIFSEYKDKLTPYTEDELKFDNIEITSLQLVTLGSGTNLENQFVTFMDKSKFDVSKGLDFMRQGRDADQVFVMFEHLNHDPFVYNIYVTNNTGRPVNGTVRIFMAPSLGFRNSDLVFKEQKFLMIEMDRFGTILNPGNNRIVRKSTESSVVVPLGQAFSSLYESNVTFSQSILELPQINNETTNDYYCGCGWPQHMLVPRGTAGGYPMDLFVMITDYEQDAVKNPKTQGPTSNCKSSMSFCGLRDKLYPDRRAMGYPFDRPINVGNLKDFTDLYGNMTSKKVKIFFDENRQIMTLNNRDSGGNARRIVTRLDFDVPDKK